MDFKFCDLMERGMYVHLFYFGLGVGLSMGVDRVRPGWLEGNLISGLNDDGDNAVFLGRCKEFGISTLGMLTDVFDDDV